MSIDEECDRRPGAIKKNADTKGGGEYGGRYDWQSRETSGCILEK
ncbi:hypothetical protein [Tardiphaga sp.]|nr:hypothetical protein [Tardiphaga sp.]